MKENIIFMYEIKYSFYHYRGLAKLLARRQGSGGIQCDIKNGVSEEITGFTKTIR
jgi:hypothetical protein